MLLLSDDRVEPEILRTRRNDVSYEDNEAVRSMKPAIWRIFQDAMALSVESKLPLPLTRDLSRCFRTHLPAGE